MQIYIKTSSGKRLALDVNPNATVHRIKEQIQEIEGIPWDCQRLSINLIGKELKDGLTLSDYNIQNMSYLQLDIHSSTTLNLKLDLTQVVSSMINTDEWKFDEFREDEKRIYKIKYQGKHDIATLLESIDLSNSSYPLIITMQPPNDTELIIEHPDHQIPLIWFNDTCIAIKLDSNKTKISTDIECIRKSYTTLQETINKHEEAIENLEMHELLTSIPECKSFKQFSKHKDVVFNRYIFDRIDRDIERNNIEYEKESIVINGIIAAASKKLSTEQTKFNLEINKLEYKMAALDVRVADLEEQWPITREKIFDELTQLIQNKERELHQTFELWTLQQVIEWLRYCKRVDVGSNGQSVMQKLKMINLNGSKLNEMSDSLLVLVGIKDPETRKSILKAVNDLFDKYGGHKYSKTQLCCVCMMNEVNMCLVPCGHMCYCHECGQRSFDHSNKCPICRKDITTMVRTFKAGLES